MLVCETERLTIRHFREDDGPFVLALFNDDSFIKYIGDKRIRNHSDAADHIKNKFYDSYRKFGYGPYLMELKDGGAPIGLCGLVKRDDFEYPDLGYALLPEYCGSGYAKEASQAVLNSAHEGLGISRFLAITALDNNSSNGLLQKLGFYLKGHCLFNGATNNLYEYNV